MGQFGKMKRIRRINMPGEGEINSGLESTVRKFIVTDVRMQYDFIIKYISGQTGIIPVAMIEVYRQFQDESGMYGEPIKFGVYQSIEWKRFESDIARASDDNPTGDVELTPNIVYNGLFNAYPDPLDGWEIDIDGTGGGLSITGNLNRLIITSSGTGSFVVINNRSTIENLVEYETVVNVNKIVNNADVNILVGSTPGTSRSVRGVFTENIISGGSDVSIGGNITDPDAIIELEYVIINKNG